MPIFTININMDKRCPECGKGGATDNGLCLGCTKKAMDSAAKMKSENGKRVQERWNMVSAKIRRPAR